MFKLLGIQRKMVVFKWIELAAQVLRILLHVPIAVPPLEVTSTWSELAGRLVASEGLLEASRRLMIRGPRFSCTPLHILSLTSRSPAYHCGHLNWVIGIVVATRVFQSTHLPI